MWRDYTDNELPIWSVGGKDKFGLYMDTGAAGNLSGDIYLNNYTSKVLMKMNLSVLKEPGSGSFSGISGDALTCKEIWTVPIFLGGGTGQTSFQSHILVDSKLPPLLSLEAMKSQGVIIDTCNDRMLYPIAQGIYQIFTITYNGHHFILPIDKIEDQAPADYLSMSTLRKTPEEIKYTQAEVGEHQPNIDLRERKRARDNVKFEAWANDVEKQVAQALLAGKSLPELTEDQWKKFSEKMKKREVEELMGKGVGLDRKQHFEVGSDSGVPLLEMKGSSFLVDTKSSQGLKELEELEDRKTLRTSTLKDPGAKVRFENENQGEGLARAVKRGIVRVV